jgi:hypothetical protein
MFDRTEDPIARIERQLEHMLGTSDYLNILRAMTVMRGNASTITDLLSTLLSLGKLSEPAKEWYTGQLQDADLQLHRDINSLLDETEGFFTRVYSEEMIEGDGYWMQIISDRPVDQNGMTFEYRLAMPTVLLLISVRLTMMKYVDPAFVMKRIHSVEIDRWWHRVGSILGQIRRAIKTTPITPIEIQRSRRLASGQELGSYSEWEQHRFLGPPHSINPIGAIEITTGFGTIDWEHVQFDEWYLGQGELYGRSAGYWPPSVGPQWYQPPLQATGLPPLNDETIQRYYRQMTGDAGRMGQQIEEQLGLKHLEEFDWKLFELAYPLDPAQVPNVIGLNRSAAEDRITSNLLVPEAILSFDANGKGLASAQSPRAGETVPVQTPVKVCYPTPLGWEECNL